MSRAFLSANGRTLEVGNGATIPKLSVALFEREVVFKRDHRGAVPVGWLPCFGRWSATCLKAALDYRRGPQEAFRVTAMLPLGRKTAEISQWRPTMRHWITSFR